MENRPNSDVICAKLNKRIQALNYKLFQLQNRLLILRTSRKFEQLEDLLDRVTRKIKDLIAAICLQRSIDALEEASKKLARGFKKKLKNFGRRLVRIRLSGGTEVEILVPYYAQSNPDTLKTMAGKRGCYPALILLGIHDHCSPRLASEISMMIAALSSIKEAQEMLAGRGCNLDFKTLRNIMKRYAARARMSQENGDCLDGEIDATGLRLVVAADGGRVRIRKNKKGPKTQKNRRRYRTDWREPKLFIIYVLDENGRQNRKFAPIMDASMGGPDELFALIEFYLEKINAKKAESVTFLADGAIWIWDRIEKLRQTVLVGVKTYCGLDFYHAIDHLNDLIALLKFPAADKKRYFNEYRHLLKKGHIDKVIEFIKANTKGTRNKELIRERKYFLKNRERMHYGILAGLKLPIGSGAVESAIRRVINLRLKGPGIFWHEESANEMLMLRCYYKAGRWGLLHKMASEVTMAGIC